MIVSNFNIRRLFPNKRDIDRDQQDLVPVETPLEVFLYSRKKEDYERFTVFMRTPHNDFELVVGFIFTEQFANKYSDIEKIFYCKKVEPEMYGNTIRVILKPHIDVDSILKNKRNFIGSSSCGICGNLLIKKIEYKGGVNKGAKFSIHKDFIFSLPNISLKEQIGFKYTGGIHASSLFSSNGDLISIKEDIGRHNALDKLIGYAVIGNKLNVFEKSLLLLSGRVSYELVQKTIMAGIPVICALGAPSSLAVELAKNYNIMLIAFLNRKKFNIYSTSTRVQLLEENYKRIVLNQV